MKIRNYLILGAVVVGLSVVAFNVFSTGTDTNLDAVTESVTSNTAQPTTATNPTTVVEPAPAIGGVNNDVESGSGVVTQDADNNSSK